MSVSSAAARQLTHEGPPVVSHPSSWDCAHASEGPEVLSSSSVGPVATQPRLLLPLQPQFPCPIPVAASTGGRYLVCPWQ